jgi:hypothetical protein
MSTIIERLEATAIRPSFLSRRRFLRQLIGFCAGVTAVAAGVAQPIVAEAYTWNCCDLLYAWCTGGHCCPGESNHYEWWCSTSACRSYSCNECYTCQCSYGFYLGNWCAPTG